MCAAHGLQQAVNDDSADSEEGKPQEIRGLSFAHVVYAMTLVRNADAVHAYSAWLEARARAGKGEGAGGREVR